MIEMLVAMAMLVWLIALGLAPSWMESGAEPPRLLRNRRRPVRLHHSFLT